MKRVLTLLLLCWSACAWSQSINVLHVFSPSALSYLQSQSVSPTQWINSVVPPANTAVTGSGLSFQFTTPASPQYLVTASTFNDARLSGAISRDIGVGAIRDATASDIVVAVTDFGPGVDDELTGPYGGDQAYVNWPLITSTNPAGTVTVNVRSPTANYNWLHQVLDHWMGAGHQRVPTDTGAPYNHGAYYDDGGSTTATCHIYMDVTTSRKDLDRTVHIHLCSASWTAGWMTPSQQMCDFGQWCVGWSQTPSGQNGPPAGYSSFFGTLTGSGPTGPTQLTCLVKGNPTGGGTAVTVNSAQAGYGAAGLDGIITCPAANDVVVGVISGQNSYGPGGIHLGSAMNDNVTYLATKAAAIAALHTQPRAPTAQYLDRCFRSQADC